MEAGAAFRWHFTKAQACLSIGDQARFEEHVAAAERVAEAQKSPVQQRLATLLRGCAVPTSPLQGHRSSGKSSEDPFLGVLAREIVCAVESVSERAFAAVGRATEGAAHRWRALSARAPARSRTDGSGSCSHPPRTDRTVLGCAAPQELLATRPGSWQDLVRAPLEAARSKGLDRGSWTHLGSRRRPGRRWTRIRRKVLALLAFLVSQPNGSATPDRVMDALWPDLDPEQGSNSIHQTIYFLRRVIDPDYRAGVSPEYLHFDSETIWIDSELVSCRSWRCQRRSERASYHACAGG